MKNIITFAIRVLLDLLNSPPCITDIPCSIVTHTFNQSVKLRND